MLLSAEQLSTLVVTGESESGETVQEMTHLVGRGIFCCR